MLKLKLVKGPLAGHVFEQKGSVVRIGRGHDRHVRLKEDQASRRHGEFSCVAGRLVYTDTNSHNGTLIHFHDGRQQRLNALLNSQELSVGDEIEIGQSRMRIIDFQPPESIDDAEDSASRFTVMTSLRGSATGAATPAKPKPIALDDDLLTDFLRLPGFKLTTERKLAQAVALRIAHAFKQFRAVSVVTLRPQAIGKDRIERQDIECLATHRCADHRSEVDLSLAILQETARQGSAVCFSESAFPDSDSVAVGQMTSCVCAPLLSEHGIIGFIQAFTDRFQTGVFGRGDLSSVAMFAGIASLLVQQGRTLQRETKLQTFASVGQVVAGMSHDARNILFSLGEFTTVVESEFPGLSESKNWRQVLDDIEFLRFFVQDTWSRIGSRRRPPRPEAVNVRTLCEQIMARCRRYFLQDQQLTRIELDAPDTCNITISVDSQLLSVALFNVFKNAIDASKSVESETTGEPPKIKLRTGIAEDQGQRWIDLHIIDEAGGIPQDVRRRLGHELISTKGELGSGLGVRLIQEQLARLGGQLIVASSTQDTELARAGTCMTLRLPLKSVTTEAADDPQPIEFVEDFGEYLRKILY